MATLYDGNGNAVEIEGGASVFDVTDYGLFTNDAGDSARQAVLTYNGKKLYPKNYAEQRLDLVKNYGGGVMLALGDSYTAMGAKYFSAFAESHGLICDNRGLASSTIAGTEDNTVGYYPFWHRLDAAIAQYNATGGHTVNGTKYTADDVKLIVFMGGANDWTTVDESKGIDRLGNPESEDKAQLYGACKYIFNAFLSSFPNADVVVILQPSNPAKGNHSMWLKESIVRNVAEMYSLPVCDCCFNWHKHNNASDATTYWQTDRLHMTDAGNKAIFDKLEKVINTLDHSRNA